MKRAANMLPPHRGARRPDNFFYHPGHDQREEGPALSRGLFPKVGRDPTPPKNRAAPRRSQAKGGSRIARRYLVERIATTEQAAS